MTLKDPITQKTTKDNKTTLILNFEDFILKPRKKFAKKTALRVG